MQPAIDALLIAQAEHFTVVDPLLPRREPPEGTLVSTAAPGGRQVSGVLTHDTVSSGAIASLWSAREVWTMHPLCGDPAGVGIDALLREWCELMRGGAVPPADSACVLTWPSRDVAAGGALLAHGLVPLSALAVRTGALRTEPREQTAPVLVRQAAPGDLSSVVALAIAELGYSARIGGAFLREDAEQLKRASLAYRLGCSDTIWLAERDGVAVGMAEAVLVDNTREHDSLVQPGYWAYVNCLSVLPEQRGAGIGGQLMAAVHERARAEGTTGCYLYYNPPNPLSSVFWPRHGYRPLWTIWEARPANALR